MTMMMMIITAREFGLLLFCCDYIITTTNKEGLGSRGRPWVLSPHQPDREEEEGLVWAIQGVRL